MSEVLYYQSDNLLKVNDVTNNATGVVITGATVTVTLVEIGTATEVTGQSWPATLNDDGGGDYSVTLTDSMSLDLTKQYTAKITINGGAGLQLYKELTLKPIIDDES